MLAATEITHLHDRLTTDWHQGNGAPTEIASDPFLALVAHQHRANYELWHIEDEARRPGASDAELALGERRVRVRELVERVERDLLR